MSWKALVISWFVYLVVHAFRVTYRIRVFGMEHRRLAESLHARGSFAMALWHEQLWAAIVAHAGQKIAPLASLSKDGDIVTYVLNRLGYRTIRGSSSRRGEEARDELVAMTDEGWFTAITVDGPRGPRRRVKGGVVDVARRTGVAVLPMVAISSRPLIMSKSWDRFQIPLPFSRIAVRYGEPVPVAADIHGLAFGEAKSTVKSRLEETERLARKDLAGWRAPVAGAARA